MWKYQVTTGDTSNPAGQVIGVGYSGRFEGLNNPAMQAEHNVGPIPVGKWTIGRFFDDPEKGKIVAHLTPCEGTETHGRSGFMIHGDNKAMNHTASEGCIILGHYQRETMMASNDRILEVVA
jgi:hypothetical protein